jgi:hypothetical protein
MQKKMQVTGWKWGSNSDKILNVAMSTSDLLRKIGRQRIRHAFLGAALKMHD